MRVCVDVDACIDVCVDYHCKHYNDCIGVGNVSSTKFNEMLNRIIFVIVIINTINRYYNNNNNNNNNTITTIKNQ